MANLPGTTGNDTLDGGTENDLIVGGPGDDTITGGDGIDRIVGDGKVDGGDTGASYNDIIDGGAGSDIIDGKQGDDEIEGGLGNDTLDGGSDNDVLYGGEGNDTLNGDKAMSTIPPGLEGAPLILWELAPQGELTASTVDMTFDVISGPQVHDVVGIDESNYWYVNNATAQNLVIDGADVVGATRGGNVVLADGTISTDKTYTAIFAVEEDDGTIKYFVTFGTQKSLDYTPTSSPWDEIQATGSPLQIIFGQNDGYGGLSVNSLATGVAVESGSADYYFIDATEEPVAMILDDVDNPGDDSLYGGEGDDTLAGNQGDDKLYGGTGNDDLTGNTGADIISGGEGDDVIEGDEASMAVGDDLTGDPLILWEVRPTTEIDATSTTATFDVISGPEIHDVVALNGDLRYWYVNSTEAGVDNVAIDGMEALGAVRGGTTILADGSAAVGEDFTAIFRVEVNGESKFYATFGTENATDYDTSKTSLDEIQLTEGSPSQIVFNDPNGSYFAGTKLSNFYDGAEVKSGAAHYYFINAGENPDMLYIDIPGGPGNDIIDGGDGNDIINAGAGDDTVSGGMGDDVITGDIGNDEIYGDVGPALPFDDTNLEGDMKILYEVLPRTDIDATTTEVTFDIVSGPVIYDVVGLQNDNNYWYVNNTDPDKINLKIDGREVTGATRGGIATFADGTAAEGNQATAIFAVENNGVTKYYTTFGNKKYADLDPANVASDDITAKGEAPTEIVFNASNGVVGYTPSYLANGLSVESGAASYYFIDPNEEPGILDVVGGESAAGGNDNIKGGFGDDTIHAGGGDDTVDGGNNVDAIYGGFGNDTITVGEGDTAEGGYDRDRFEITTDQLGDGSAAITIDGGTGSVAKEDVDDYDVLDLGDLTMVADTLVQSEDEDGNSTSGTMSVTDGTNTYAVTFNEIEAIVCFTADTMIDTENGRVRAADLKVGDMVHTLDNGLQPVLWKGSRKFTGGQLVAQPKLRPVRIKAGALAAGVPANDLIVSPQHRVLVSSKLASRMFGEAEILVAAKKLVMLDGIDYIDAFDGVEYIHFLCPQHEIVFSDGTPTETLYTGREALSSLPMEAQEEIFAIFPELETMDADTLPTPARTILSGRQTRKFVMRHVQNNRGILEV